jgi:ABC-type multidrug transport system ATPase subunit
MRQTSELLVETRGLTKRYGDAMTAVDALDLRVGRGEVYGFLGPNGAGKTTTLRMLVGLIRPTSGHVTVAGQPAGHPAGLARVGSLIESPAFYPYLSGRENLRVLADYCGIGYRRVDEVLDVVDLVPRAGDRYGTYSHGMKQRLGVAAAMLKSPDLLILDEPTNGFDPQGMAEMRGLVRRLGQDRRTVLLSSHLLGEVEHVCDRVGIIHRGRLVAESAVSELRGQAGLVLHAEPMDRARAVLQDMLGTDAVTQVNGSLRLAAGRERAGEVSLALAGAGVAVTELGVVERSLEDVFFQLTGQEVRS